MLVVEAASSRMVVRVSLERVLDRLRAMKNLAVTEGSGGGCL